MDTTDAKRDRVAAISAESLTGLDAVLRGFRPIPRVAGLGTSLLPAAPRRTWARL